MCVSVRPWLCCVVLAVSLSAPLARADSDHDRARAAVQAGQVMPLAQVLQRLERTHPGQVLEVELERSHGAWVYEIRLLQAGGRLRKLELDARTGEPIGTETRKD